MISSRVTGPIMKCTDHFSISHSLVAKWSKAHHRGKLKHLSLLKSPGHGKRADSKAAKKTHMHPGAKARYHDQEVAVMKKIKAEREKGRRVSGRFIRVAMRKEIRASLGNDEADKFRASPGWFNAFLRRNNLSLRVKSNSKSASLEQRLPKVKRWHARLRRRLHKGKQRSPKWGRWLPTNRFNVFQVPLTLQDANQQTYTERGSSRVWIRGSKKGDDKREATLQLCVRLTDDSEIGQPYPVLIFRGQGKRITQQEKDAWDDRVEVKFQPKAWADEPFNLWYAQECFPLFVEDGESNVLFLDNLGTQATDEVVQAYKTMANTKVHFLPSDTTDIIQPIDAGIGLRVKQKIREEHEKWMEEDQNLSKWVNGQVKAWERRVLITR